MASIWRDARSENYLIKFHFGGRRYLRSCQTRNEREANRLKAAVEETLNLVSTGRLKLPDDVTDPALWILSGGKVSGKPVIQRPSWELLGDTCDAYLDAQLHKAGTTLIGERVHLGHLKRLLGVRTRLDAIQLGQLQQFVSKRLKESNRHGRLVMGETVKKELLTFTQVWDFARQHGVVRRPCPVKNPDRPKKWAVSLPLPAEPEKFMHWSEIERRVARLPKEDPERNRLWRFLYLDAAQRDELLEHVRETAAYPFVLPMIAFAALTGARRSEICRSLIEDFKFESNVVVIREKKRRKNRSASTREVPMHPQLRAIMDAWLREHPGGQFTIAAPLRMARRAVRLTFDALTPTEASHHFKMTLKEGKWNVIAGFHVLRHSFGAICARNTLPMSVTGKWMGHTSEEMMRHYQHLFPDDEQMWMQRLG